MTRARAKAVIWRLVAALPCRCWPLASGIVRGLWRGIRHE
jgi:hypothetical protein